MRILVNTRLLLPNKLEGIGWFTFENLKRITRNHPEHQFFFLFDRPYSKEFVFSENITPIVAGPPTRHPVLWYLWFEWVVPYIVKKHKIDLFLSPDGYTSLRAKVKKLLVIHDINFVHRPDDLPYLIGKYYNHFTPKFAKEATRIATVSEYSKADIVESFGISQEKVDVVYNGANENYTPIGLEEQEKVRKQFTNGAKYFIFIGALHPRKNVARLLEAFDLFRKETGQDIKLMIVGEKMFKSAEIENTYQKMSHSDDVIFSGRLEPETLRRMLGSALALTFVPYFEGFGIPILEAMYCDTPVISSKLTAMPEVAGDAAIMVDPFSIDEIVEALKKLDNNQDLRQQLIEKGRGQRKKFSWDKSAERLWESIEKTIRED